MKTWILYLTGTAKALPLKFLRTYPCNLGKAYIKGFDITTQKEKRCRKSALLSKPLNLRLLTQRNPELFRKLRMDGNHLTERIDNVIKLVLGTMA